MARQQRPVGRGIHRVFWRHWRWVLGSGVCLVVACVIARAPSPRWEVLHRSTVAIVHAVQSIVDDQRADPFTERPSQLQDPAMQGVMGYLRAHQVAHRSRWEQVIDRVRSYIGRYQAR